MGVDTTSTCLVTIWLFGRPTWELGGSDVNADELLDLAEEMWERLSNVSKWVRRLQRRGWDTEVGLYEIQCTKEMSKYRVKRELNNLDIPLDEVHIEVLEEGDEVEGDTIHVDRMDPDSDDFELGVEP